MKYFNNPRTEEELKDQYRRLLIKYDYRSEKNAKIIAELRAEYNSIQMQIKRANGYRTIPEKIADGVRDIHSDYIKDFRAKEQRISQLKNHVYTKNEIQNLFDKTKLYASKISYDIIKRQLLPYISMHKVVTTCSPEQICRWFNSTALNAVDDDLKQHYDEMREELEYALKSQTTDKKAQEKLMVQMEKLIGNHISIVFNKYESELIDPIVVAELNMQKYEQKKSDKTYYKFTKVLFVAGWIIGCLYLIFEGLTNKYMDITLSIVLLIGYSVLICIMYVLLIKLPQKINKSFEKTTTAGIGYRKHNSRVTERTAYQEHRARTRLISFILRFLGF